MNEKIEKYVATKLPAFGKRKYSPDVWNGGEKTGDEINFIEPTGYSCPRKPVVARVKPAPLVVADGMLTGKIANYDADRGYGMIGLAGRRIFFHVSNVVGENSTRICEGVTVAYRKVAGKDGRDKAIDVQLVDKTKN